MNLWLGLVIGLKEIWAHKFRSFLTMLGVILGVASLLAMFSLTAGMARGMREYMQQVGGIEKVEVVTQEVPPEQENIWEISPGRTVVDAEAIADTVGLVTYVSPVVELRTMVEAAGESFKTEVKGAWPDYMPINKHVVEVGRSLSQLDIDRAHHVCVIGRSAVERLWPDRPDFDAIGESILVQQRPFKIVGIFEFYEREEDKRRRELKLDKGAKSSSGRPRSNRWSPFYRKNNEIVIPITTMFYEFKSATVVGTTDTGPDYKLDGLVFQVANTDRFKETLEPDQQRPQNDASRHRGLRLRYARGMVRQHRGKRPQRPREWRSHRRHLTARRRHRDYEHHAGLDHRTHPRDRRPPGRGREGARHLCANRRRVGRDRIHRGHPRPCSPASGSCKSSSPFRRQRMRRCSSGKTS